MRRFLQFILLAVFINSQLYAKPLYSPRFKRNAIRDVRRHWPNGIVPYTMDNEFTDFERGVIYKAMKDFHSVSCIRFKRHAGEEDYVEIKKGDRCAAAIGHYGGVQSLTLGDGCFYKETIIHELFHTLGFYHEQARPDRDKYIKVHESNIKPAHLKNFLKKSPLNVTTLDLPYDYHSVLHYRDNEFAIYRWLKTLTLINSTAEIGTAEEMSIMDILRLNRLYPCRMNKKREPWVVDNYIII